MESRSQTAAVTAFFSGDFFLGRYCGNYFARPLLPTSRKHKEEVVVLGIEANRLCLHCWHESRNFHLEDEAHVIAMCPLYSAQRGDLEKEITSELATLWCAATTAEAKLQALFSSRNAKDWRATGRFLARVRQIRRSMKVRMQKRCEIRARNNYTTLLRQWRREGKYVCPHGVFFDTLIPIECPCLRAPSNADWRRAILMPCPGHGLEVHCYGLI